MNMAPGFSVVVNGLKDGLKFRKDYFDKDDGRAIIELN